MGKNDKVKQQIIRLMKVIENPKSSDNAKIVALGELSKWRKRLPDTEASDE